MDILIYENDKRVLTGLANLICQLAPETVVHSELTAARVESYLRKSDGYLLCLLDIVDEVGENSGFRLAEVAREQNENNCIVFISGYWQRYVMSMKHKEIADYFISKNITPGIKPELKQVLRYARKKEGDELRIAGLHGMEYAIAYEDIFMIESVKRMKRSIIYYAGGICCVPMYIGTLFKELNDKRFFLCSRGCIVNLDKITERDMKNKILFLENGMRCHLARSKKLRGDGE